MQQDFNWNSTSRGPSAAAELLVNDPSAHLNTYDLINGVLAALFK